MNENQRLSSRKFLSQWSEIFGNKKLTNALLERLFHHSKIIQITGPLYRMKSYSEKKETK